MLGEVRFEDVTRRMASNGAVVIQERQMREALLSVRVSGVPIRAIYDDLHSSQVFRAKALVIWR